VQAAPVNVVAPGSQTFNFTGSQQSWTVPNGVTSINFTIAGAKGGNGNSGLAGGNGATMTGALAVTPGQTIFIYVGGQGTVMPVDLTEEVMAVQVLAGAEELLIYVSVETHWPIGLL
jgi:hypothetical protein